MKIDIKPLVVVIDTLHKEEAVQVEIVRSSDSVGVGFINSGGFKFASRRVKLPQAATDAEVLAAIGAEAVKAPKAPTQKEGNN